MKRLLRLVSGVDAGKVWPIDRELVLGREDADVVLADSEVSRPHAVLRAVRDGVEVEDLDSTDGTYVGGRRVQGRVTVSKNTRLRVGDTRLEIEVGPREVLAADPQTTRPRATPVAPAPGATVTRGVVRAEPAPGAPGAGAPPRPAPRRRVKLLLPIVISGVLLVVVVGLALAKLLGGDGTSSVARSRCASHFPKVIEDGFPEPPMRSSHDGRLETTLKAAPGSISVRGQRVTTFEYEGSVPGPTLVACPGDELVVHLDNQLPQPTNLHVHGLHVSPRGNGDNVFLEILPQERFTFRFRLPADHPAGAFWYHPHFHRLVNEQIDGGLAGAIVVEGGLDNRLRNIPQRLMIIQGGRSGGVGDPTPPDQGGPIPLSRRPAPGPGTRTRPPILPRPALGAGMLLVNGVQNPTVKIRPGQLQRWRILNATGVHIVRLRLRGQPFEVLAEDGQTLRFMRRTQELLITPGSRREVLVRGGPPGRYTLDTVPFHRCFKSCFDPAADTPPSGRIEPKRALLTLASSGVRVRDRLPRGPLAKAPLDLRRSRVVKHRVIVFGKRFFATKQAEFPFNGKLFDHRRVDVTMKLGAVEEWTLKNKSTAVHKEWHNFHVHQNPFQVISVNGRPLRYVDYEDTVALPPGATVVIRTKPVDFTGKLVFHCHIAFHSDQGMMGVIQVVRHPTAAQARAGSALQFGTMAMGPSARSPRAVSALRQTRER